ncbi:MAG TPA: hypothetical protein VH724_00235, partial [Candidatus Angelobacter sp.]|nr:hypothetical protein [Candidatus Angelobacter sp.]
MTVAGGQIAVEIAVVASQATKRNRPGVKARFRDDAVARRVLHGIEDALRAHVPEGKTVVLTLGAPIIEPKKLLTALQEILLGHLKSGAEAIEQRKTVLGNRVRFLTLRGDPRWSAKVLGFVFSGDPTPGLLVHALRAVHDGIAAAAERRASKMPDSERWLILVSDQWIADIKTYRHAFSNLTIPGGFKKILMVFE